MLYMSKYNERIKARQLRKNGVSIVVIASMLGVTKSSVSAWCRDITLTPEQNFKLVKNKGVSVTTGQRMGAEANKKMRLNAIRDAELYGQEMVKKISNRELLLIATALYWSEGSKSSRTSGFVFVNSDPEMILLMKKFLVSTMGVAPEDIICSVQINKIHEKRIGVVLNFWKNLLILGEEQIRKPYFVRTKTNKVYENYDTYFGVCRLIVSRSSQLKYRMNGLIKALKCNISSA